MHPALCTERRQQFGQLVAIPAWFGQRIANLRLKPFPKAFAKAMDRDAERTLCRLHLHRHIGPRTIQGIALKGRSQDREDLAAAGGVLFLREACERLFDHRLGPAALEDRGRVEPHNRFVRQPLLFLRDVEREELHAAATPERPFAIPFVGEPIAGTSAQERAEPAAIWIGGVKVFPLEQVGEQTLCQVARLFAANAVAAVHRIHRSPVDLAKLIERLAGVIVTLGGARNQTPTGRVEHHEARLPPAGPDVNGSAGARQKSQARGLPVDLEWRRECAISIPMFLPLSYWIVLGIGALLSFYAQSRVKGAFAKWSQVRSRAGFTGKQVAEAILRSNGIHDVTVEPVHGQLTDHYDPTSKTLRLSEPVYHQTSIAALGVAAHEVGHAIQHAHGYAPLRFRSAWVPVAGIGSSLGFLVLLIGMPLAYVGSPMLAWIGVLLFGATTVFTLVTLPVEFDASKRALVTLQQGGVLAGDEIPGAKSVLDAAALTYVAAAASSLLTLLYFVMQILGANRD